MGILTSETELSRMSILTSENWIIKNGHFNEWKLNYQEWAF